MYYKNENQTPQLNNNLNNQITINNNNNNLK